MFCDNCHSHVAKCLNVMGYGEFHLLLAKIDVETVHCSQEVELWNVEVVLLVFLLWKVCQFERLFEDILSFSDYFNDLLGGFWCSDVVTMLISVGVHV